MDRRRFLKFFGLAAVGVVADRVIPFGRVYSFPSKIVIPKAAGITYEALAEMSKAIFPVPQSAIFTSNPFLRKVLSGQKDDVIHGLDVYYDEHLPHGATVMFNRAELLRNLSIRTKPLDLLA